MAQMSLQIFIVQYIFSCYSTCKWWNDNNLTCIYTTWNSAGSSRPWEYSRPSALHRRSQLLSANKPDDSLWSQCFPAVHSPCGHSHSNRQCSILHWDNTVQPSVCWCLFTCRLLVRSDQRQCPPVCWACWKEGVTILAALPHASTSGLIALAL